MEKGETTEKNRKVKGEINRKARKIEAVLLLCLTSILQPVWLGWPQQDYEKLQPAKLSRSLRYAILPSRKCDSTRGE